MDPISIPQLRVNPKYSLYRTFLTAGAVAALGPGAGKLVVTSFRLPLRCTPDPAEEPATALATLPCSTFTGEACSQHEGGSMRRS